MKKTRFLSMMAAIFMVIALLAGCSSPKTSPSPSTSPSSNPTPAPIASEPAPSPQPAGKNVPDYMNETGLPIAKEKITISAFCSIISGNASWDELEAIKGIEELTNVHFDFEFVEQTQYMERLNLAVTSGDYADVFIPRNYSGPIEEERLGKEGTIIDITQLIEDWMPNFQQCIKDIPIMKPGITAGDGKIYGFPYYFENLGGNPHQVFMDDYWLGAADFTEVPDTVDEFYQLLKNIQSLDPEITPLGGHSGGFSVFQNFLVPAFTGYVRGYSLEGIDVRHNTDEVCFVALEPGFKEFLEYARMLYSEKLIEQEIFTLDGAQFNARVKAGAYAIHDTSPTVLDPEKVRGKGTSLKPLTSATNSVPSVPYETSLYPGTGLITDRCEYPELMSRWFDLFYDYTDPAPSNLNARTLRTGFLGVHWDYGDSSQSTWHFVDPVDSWAYAAQHVAPGMYLPGCDINMALTEGMPLYEQKQASVAKYQYPYRKVGFPRNARMTTEEIDSISTTLTDLKNYVNNMVGKFITGQASLEADYDEFVKTINDIGVDEVLSVYQAVYDRWQAMMN